MRPTGRVEGKVAIVTGAARGQGAAEARLLAHEGAKVILTDVLDDLLAEQVSSLQKEGHDVLGQRLDVTDFDSWKAVVEIAETAYGPVSILINNAGIYEFGGVEATDLTKWNRLVAVNQTGTFLGMKAVVPSMRRAGIGSIVNIGSVHALIGSAHSIGYHAAKGAVRMLTKAAAVEYGPINIRVNAIHPGGIHTPMNEDLDMSAVIAATPLGRKGTTDEMAAAALFLASDESSFVTGTELPVDGGMTANGPGGADSE